MTPYIFVGIPELPQHQFRLGATITAPNDIIDCACHVLNVNRTDVLSKSRKRELVECRQIAIGLIRINSQSTLKNIGKMFNRDHSTIIYACENFKDLYGVDKQFTKKVNLVKQKTNNL